MTQPTLERSVFWPSATVSSDRTHALILVSLGNNWPTVVPSTSPDNWYQPTPVALPPAGCLDIDDVVANDEKIPSRRAALEAARVRLADELYANEPYAALRVMRMRQGLSQRSLAKLLATSQSHVASVENGESDVRLSTITRWAEVLGQSVGAVAEACIAARVNSPAEPPTASTHG